MSEELRFTHLDAMNALFNGIRYLNDRIDCGDIVSAKAALKTKALADLVAVAEHDLALDGASAISIKPFVAAGGWIGVTYSYSLGAGFEVQGSPVPRRV